MDDMEDETKDETPAQQLTYDQRLEQSIAKLPSFEHFFFTYGSLVIGANGSMCAILAHRRYQRMSNLPRRILKYSLPLVSFPLLFGSSAYFMVVTQPLMFGMVKCPTCVEVASGIIGTTSSALAPVFVAGYVNAGRLPVSSGPRMAENAWSEMLRMAKPVFIRLRYFMLFEAVVSFLVARAHTNTVLKLLEMSRLPKEDDEELYDEYDDWDPEIYLGKTP